MTSNQLAEIQRALDQATTALGVAGEAMTLKKEKDAQQAILHAAEQLKRCQEVLKAIRVEG